jgi:hypothetical protein
MTITDRRAFDNKRWSFLSVLLISIFFSSSAHANSSEQWDPPSQVFELGSAPNARIQVVDCPAVAQCVVAGTLGPNDQPWVKSRNGQQWGPTEYLGFWVPDDSSQVLDLKCRTVGDCIVAGISYGSTPFIWVAQQHSGIWGDRADLSSVFDERVAANCPNAESCTFFGPVRGLNEINVKSVDYRDNQFDHQPVDTGLVLPPMNHATHFYEVLASCADDEYCTGAISVGRNGTIEAQTWAVSRIAGQWGANERISTSQSRDFYLWDMSCASAGSCYIAGSSGGVGAFAYQENHVWAPAKEAPASFPNATSQWVDEIDCPTSRLCVATGRTHDAQTGSLVLWVSRIANGDWHEVVDVSSLVDGQNMGFSDHWSISCGSATRCKLGGQTYYGHGPRAHYTSAAITDGGMSWSNLRPVIGLDAFNQSGYLMSGVSFECSGSDYCLAYGWYSDPTSGGGLPWVSNVWRTPDLPATGMGSQHLLIFSLWLSIVGFVIHRSCYRRRSS